MRTHIVVVAWLHLILSALTLMVGGALFLLCVVMGTIALPALPMFGAIGMLIFIPFLIFSLPGIIMGIGLLQFAPWARILAIVLSALGIVLHPAVGVGTALGIYSLYVLLQPETVALFEGHGSYNRP